MQITEAVALVHSRARLVRLAPLWQYGQSDFFLQQIAPHDNLGLRHLFIEGEFGGVPDAAKNKGLRYGGSPSV